jgi:hypothetical protein
VKIKSLSYSTLLHVLSFTSSIEEKEAYLVIRTVDNPGHKWGNFLMFPNPPQKQDYKRWTKAFKVEFSDVLVKHMAFAWDSIDGASGEIKAFEEKGYYFEYDDIMVASEVVKPDKFNDAITVKAVISEEDWEQAVMLNMKVSGDESDAYATFIRRLMTKYREICFANQCSWIGAYLKDELVADLGLFHAGELRGLAAMVKTHPDFREQGICRTLLYEASLMGFEQMRFNKIIMVADRACRARRVYASVGYKVEEKGASLILNSF